MHRMSAHDIIRKSEKATHEEREAFLGPPQKAAHGAAVAQPKPEPSIMQTAFDFMLCFFGLQVSYILWGMMQELIMNTEFEPTPRTPSGKFPSATFCVFSNRFLAIIVSALCCLCYHGTIYSAAPLISFSPCALSNTLSSWGQYQALSFVGFSLQTIFKSMKVIPVMIMGTVLKGTKYSFIEYVEAVGITLGVITFSMSKGNFNSDSATNQVVGFLLLCLYIVSDSFTAQWQSRIYRDYGKIDSIQMMFGVNVSAIIITVGALLLSGEIFAVYEFLSYNPSALWYNIVTAITSTTGQFAIFYTIKRFGPIVFTVIMTTRQMFSIVVSNYFFSHSMSLQSYVGAAIVFGVVGYSIRRKVVEKQTKDATAAAAAASASAANAAAAASAADRESKV